VQFTLQLTVDSTPIGAVTGLLNAFDNEYVTRFEVSGDGSAALSAGGIYRDSDLTRLPNGFTLGAGASPLVRGTTILGEISNEQPFQAYVFNCLAGEIISVDMQAVGANLDTLLQIIDPAGRVVNVNDDAGGSTNSFISNANLLSSGNYTIVATRYAKEIGGTEGEFQLTVTGATAAAAAAPINVNLPQGSIEVTLAWATSADLQLLVREPSGYAIYDDQPLSASGGLLQENCNVNCVPAISGSPVSYIYWPFELWRPGTYEVEVWYQNACSELPPAVNFTLQAEVNGQTILNTIEFPQPGQRYVSHFNVVPAGAAAAGAGGFIDAGSQTLDYQAAAFDAPEIQSNSPVFGQISAEKPFDVYRFEGAAGESVTITMAATQLLDTNLYLISPSGIEVAANDDTSPDDTNSLIGGYVLTENGPYTIIATRFGNQYGGTIGPYQLMLSKN